MEKAGERGLDWAGLPVIATVARLPCHAGRIRDEPRTVTPSRGGSRSWECPGALLSTGARAFLDLGGDGATAAGGCPRLTAEPLSLLGAPAEQPIASVG